MHPKQMPRAMHRPSRTVETVGSDSEVSQSVEEHDESSDNDEAADSDEDMPRTDYNNPAKATSQNYQRKVKGGPYVGEPSTIDYEKYKMHFGGAPINVIEKTFEKTPHKWGGRQP